MIRQVLLFGLTCLSHCTNQPDTLTLGDVSQVASELAEQQPGPERDLVWGKGLSIEQTAAAMTFALGAAPVFVAEYRSMDEFWGDVTAELNAGRPLIGANPHHAFVIRGYQQSGGRRYIHVYDPANGRQMIDIDAARLPAAMLSTFRFPSQPNVARQEASVTATRMGTASSTSTSWSASTPSPVTRTVMPTASRTSRTSSRAFSRWSFSWAMRLRGIQLPGISTRRACPPSWIPIRTGPGSATRRG